MAGRGLSVHASYGIPRGPTAATTAEELIRCAAVAIYQAKQGGGRSCRLFAFGMQVPASNRPLGPSYHPADAGG